MSCESVVSLTMKYLVFFTFSNSASVKLFTKVALLNLFYCSENQNQAFSNVHSSFITFLLIVIKCIYSSWLSS